MLNKTITELYYSLKPFIPRNIQIYIRRAYVRKKLKQTHDIWPIDPTAASKPAHWSGWPEGKQFALILTHDVETDIGQGRCYDLLHLEQSYGFRSSFNFVPERYSVSKKLREYIVREGFEVGVHDLNHDGKLYNSSELFRKRSHKINQYLEDWKCEGFRSGAMHCNLDWIHDLDITYDCSTFDTDPFEPKAEGICTIFPFWVSNGNDNNGYVEMPYTLPQDFTLFVLFQERSIDIWKRKLDWIAENGGMVLINTHPDYMNFNGNKIGIDEYPVEYYAMLLDYIRSKYKDQYWHPLPVDMARYCRENKWSKINPETKNIKSD